MLDGNHKLRRHRAPFPGGWAAWGLVLCLVVVSFPFAASAQFVNFTQNSVPLGLVSTTNDYEAGILVTTVTAPMTSGVYRFTHWTVNGVEKRDLLGRGINPVSFTLVQDTTATAHYTTTSGVDADLDVDGIPDWYEFHMIGNLDQDAMADLDDDGFDLKTEYARDYHPGLVNEIVDGGFSLTTSAPITVIIDLDNLCWNVKQSDPLGVQATTREVVARNTTITHGDHYGTISSGRFTHWDLNGTRQEDVTGRALGGFSFDLTEDSTATVHYVPTSQDSDADGVPDWYEINQYGNLDQAGDSDTDADGFDLKTEYQRDYHPRLVNEIVDGGFSLTTSPPVTVIVDPNLAWDRKGSDPQGLLTTTATVKTKGDTITLSDAYGTNGSYRFYEWQLNGVRQEDVTGRALAGFSYVLAEDSTATAKFIVSGADSDADGIPDWYELNMYGNLDHDAASDTDGDGFDLLTEYRRDYHPRLNNEIVDGGFSLTTSPAVTVVVDPNLAWDRKGSDPAGLLSTSATVKSKGDAITLADAYGANAGYHFYEWQLNGTRQEDVSGRALGGFSYVLAEDSTATAKFIASGADSDGDGIPDWYELNMYGNLDHDAASDTDGDGFDLHTEYRRDYHPRLVNEIVDGGFSLTTSPVVRVDLQHFPRRTQILVAGIRTDFFGASPATPGSFDVGAHSRPAAGDWDGDGDADLFVGSDSATIAVFMNDGSPAVLNLVQQDDLTPPVAQEVGWMPALGDWSADGLADLAVADNGGTVHFYVSDGAWEMTDRTPDYTLHTQLPMAGITFFEGTGDGLPDLLILKTDGKLVLIPNHGSVPHFDENGWVDDFGGGVANGLAGTGLARADLDGDEFDDLLIATADGKIWEFRGSAAGLQVKSAVYGGTFSGFASNLAITVLDADGDGDVDIFGGDVNGGLVYLADQTAHLGISPHVRTVLVGEEIRFEITASKTVGNVGWAFHRNGSGASLDPLAGVYMAGTVSGIDCVTATDEAGRQGRAWINVIDAGQVGSAGRAVILAGRRSATDSVWPSTHALAETAYSTMRYRGLSADNILYLTHSTSGHSSFDGVPTRQALGNALDPAGYDPGTPSLLLFFVDHGRLDAPGGEGRLVLSENENLSGTELDALLDAFQAEFHDCTVTVILDCCYAGDIAAAIAPEGNQSRAVISSTSPGELSHFISTGLVSFSQMFWSDVAMGLTLAAASMNASAAMETFQHGFIDAPDQYANARLGPDFVVGEDKPQITRVCPEHLLTGTETATLWAEGVVGPSAIQKVWAVVVPPDYLPTGESPITDLPEVELQWYSSSRRWEASWGGFAEGNPENPYTILFYAQDIWGSISYPRKTHIAQTGVVKRVIIAAMGDPTSPAAGAYGMLADLAAAISHTRRVAPEDIRYLSDFAPLTRNSLAPVTKAALAAAVTQWANESGHLTSLTVYLVGDADAKGFHCATGETITPQDVGAWFDQLRNEAVCEINLVAEGHNSGQFLAVARDELPARVIMTSTSADRPTELGYEGWSSFGRWVWSSIGRGDNLRGAFASAQSLARSFTGSATCLLDDTGDGTFSKKTDGRAAMARYIGTAFVTGDDPSYIGICGGTRSVSPGGSAAIWANNIVLPDGCPPGRVWAEVMSPAYPERRDGGIVNLQWQEASQRYLGVYSAFLEPGIYTVVVHAGSKDDPVGVSLPGRISIYFDTPFPAQGTVPEDMATLPLDGTNLNGQIDAGELTTAYRFSAVAGQILTFTLLNIDTWRDLSFAVRNGTDADILAYADDWGQGLSEKIELWPVPYDGEYVLEVTNVGFSALTSYTVRASIVSAADGFAYLPTVPQAPALINALLNRAALPPEERLAADLNADGVVDLADLIWLLKEPWRNH